jgi:hypothetical protein
MPGLVPGIDALQKFVVKIAPFSVPTIYQPGFPGAWPSFHVLFSLDREWHRRMLFEVNEPLQPVTF